MGKPSSKGPSWLVWCCKANHQISVILNCHRQSQLPCQLTSHISRRKAQLKPIPRRQTDTTSSNIEYLTSAPPQSELPTWSQQMPFPPTSHRPLMPRKPAATTSSHYTTRTHVVRTQRQRLQHQNYKSPLTEFSNHHPPQLLDPCGVILWCTRQDESCGRAAVGQQTYKTKRGAVREAARAI